MSGIFSDICFIIIQNDPAAWRTKPQSNAARQSLHSQKWRPGGVSACVRFWMKQACSCHNGTHLHGVSYRLVLYLLFYDSFFKSNEQNKCVRYFWDNLHSPFLSLSLS